MTVGCNFLSYCKRLTDSFKDPTWRIQYITTIQVTELISEITVHAHFGYSGRKGEALGLKVVQLPEGRVSFITFITLAPLTIKIL